MYNWAYSQQDTLKQIIEWILVCCNGKKVLYGRVEGGAWGSGL